MYSIGEHVIHPGQGVCTVMGYEETPAPMVVLEARRKNTATRLHYPVEQLGRLHPCIGRTQAEALISGYGELECDPFTERNSALEEAHFKERIKHGAPDTVIIAKTMRARILDCERRSKKPSSYYARVLKEAHARSVAELAVALDRTENDVEELIIHAVEAFETASATN